LHSKVKTGAKRSSRLIKGGARYIMAKNHFLDEEPAVDRVMKVVVALARETYVLKDRLGIVERKLDEKGVVTRSDLDEFKPTPEEEKEILAARDAFVESILSPIVTDRIDVE